MSLRRVLTLVLFAWLLLLLLLVIIVFSVFVTGLVKVICLLDVLLIALVFFNALGWGTFIATLTGSTSERLAVLSRHHLG